MEEARVWVVPVGIHGHVAMVSSQEDYDLLKPYKWNLHQGGYAQASVNGRMQLMHRFLLRVELAPGLVVDHINMNKLDNRRENLRICTQAENACNRRSLAGSSSRFKGVSWDGRRRKWEAKIMANRITVHLGRFDNEEDAARAYDRSVRDYQGEFARLNFPE